jgi:hypothetical protein
VVESAQGCPFKANIPGRLTSRREDLSVYALLFTFLFVTHAPLLRLPYFWDEAGYYIPAARDLLLTGSLIPYTTLSNAHPPLVMLWLAFWWKFSAFTPAVTRTAMLMVAAFALLGLWRLSRDVANEAVAVATVLCTALYPVFFTQSSLAHLDMMAAAFTFWGLAMYVERRPVATIVFFALAPMAKETAIVTPLALLAWELLCPVIGRELQSGPHVPLSQQASCAIVSSLSRSIAVLVWLSSSPHRLLSRKSLLSPLQSTGDAHSSAHSARAADPCVARLRISESVLAHLGCIVCHDAVSTARIGRHAPSAHCDQRAACLCRRSGLRTSWSNQPWGAPFSLVTCCRLCRW